MSIQKNNRLKPLILLLASAAAHAAPPQIPNSGLLLRESRPLPELPTKRPQIQIETPDTPRPPMQAKNNLRVTVQYFQFTGNSQFTNNELQALLSKYKNRPINFNDLQAAAKIITDYYRQAGFLVARAYLPEQDIKNGIVEILILEGHLDGSHLNGKAIEHIGDTRIDNRVIQRFLDTYPANGLVTDKELSHLSLLINDLAGVQSRAVLSQGKKNGTSALTLKVQQAPLISGYVSTDNHGLYSTGYYRFDSGINIVDPFGFGDQLTLRIQSTETGGSVMGSADYNLPINGYGTRFGLSFFNWGVALVR